MHVRLAIRIFSPACPQPILLASRIQPEYSNCKAKTIHDYQMAKTKKDEDVSRCFSVHMLPTNFMVYQIIILFPQIAGDQIQHTRHTQISYSVSMLTIPKKTYLNSHEIPFSIPMLDSSTTILSHSNGFTTRHASETKLSPSGASGTEVRRRRGCAIGRGPTRRFLVGIWIFGSPYLAGGQRCCNM